MSATTAPTCGHSTGTITGCQPLCSAPATTVVLIHGGLRTPTRAVRCARHVPALENSAWPYRITTHPLV